MRYYAQLVELKLLESRIPVPLRKQASIASAPHGDRQVRLSIDLHKSAHIKEVDEAWVDVNRRVENHLGHYLTMSR